MSIKNKEINPLVSFCLFSYNQEEFIADAVKGALEQNYSPLEIIISDDCSTDKTFQIIEEIVEKYKGTSKIILNKNKQNLGLTSHINKVFAMSKGEYIFVAAGDDISLPERTAKFVEVFQKNTDIVSISCHLKSIDSKGNVIPNTNDIKENILYDVNDYLSKDDFHVNGASRAIKRKVFENFGDLNVKCPTEDTPYLLRVFMTGKVYQIAEELVLYRTHGNNLSGESNVYKMSINEIYKQYKKDIIRAKKNKIINEVIANKLLLKVKAIKNIRIKRKRQYKINKFKQRVKHILLPNMNKELNLWWTDKSISKNFGDIVAPYIISKIYDVKIIDIRKELENKSFKDIFYRNIYRIPNLGIKTINFFSKKKKKVLVYHRKIRNKRTFQNFIGNTLFGIRNIFYKTKKLYNPVYYTIGSIIRFSKTNNAVWGAGIISKTDFISGGCFYAVRGYKTIDRLLELGFKVSDIVGDPALLLPITYKPNYMKKYKLGIIPHVIDFEYINKKNKLKDVLVINLDTGKIEDTIDAICSCEYTMSSSLHGLIVSHAYNIPSIWFESTKKLMGDNTKFYDYFSSVKIDDYNCFPEDTVDLPVYKIIEIIQNNEYLCKINVDLSLIQKKLINALPFKKREVIYE